MQSFIGYAVDEDMRFHATAGGIGSVLLKYLFDRNIIRSAISLQFNPLTLEYEPRLIYGYKDYDISGSVYHEINLIRFVKSKMSEIKDAFFCFALPCQVQSIRKLLRENGIQGFIVGLACSSQQSFEATKYLLNRLGIPLSTVKNIRYRGFGWPSGIHVLLNNGEAISCPNNNSLWSDIFHSRLFIQERCFQCSETISSQSDVSLADPWLEEYVVNEKKGQTLVLCNTDESVIFLEHAKDLGYMHLEAIDYTLLKKSQMNTEIRKGKYIRRRKLIGSLQKIFSNPIYRRVVLKFPLCFKIHCVVLHKLESLIK